MNNRIAFLGLLFSSTLAVATVSHAAPQAVKTSPASGVLVTFSVGDKLLSSRMVKFGDATSNKGEFSNSTNPDSPVLFKYTWSVRDLPNSQKSLSLSWTYRLVGFTEYDSNGVFVQFPDVYTDKGHLDVTEPFTGTKKVGDVTVDFHKL